MHRKRPYYGLIIVVSCFICVSYLFSPRSGNRKVTIVLSAYETSGSRPKWLRRTLSEYTSAAFSDIIDQVILVWNEPAADPPNLPQDVTVVRGTNNSMNNRWLLTPSLIRTEAVLVLDDDIAVNKDGIGCLLQVFQRHSDRLLGPFARRRDGQEYVLDELMAVPGSSYDFILPRIMMLHRRFLNYYGAQSLKRLHRFVDDQEAHCDDLLLNLVVAGQTQKSPMRVALPPGSVADYAAVCGPLDRESTSGLADQSQRWSLRNECLKEFVTSPALSHISHTSSDVVATCNAHDITETQRVSLQRWRSMSQLSAQDLCPELLSGSSIAPPRGGLGGVLQEYCPEVDKSTTEWIDALLMLPLCNGESKTDLIRSAHYQCGSWCIWDLATPARNGWHLTGRCFEAFSDGHPSCDEWWYQRPRMNL